MNQEREVTCEDRSCDPRTIARFSEILFVSALCEIIAFGYLELVDLIELLLIPWGSHLYLLVPVALCIALRGRRCDAGFPPECAASFGKMKIAALCLLLLSPFYAWWRSSPSDKFTTANLFALCLAASLFLAASSSFASKISALIGCRRSFIFAKFARYCALYIGVAPSTSFLIFPIFGILSGRPIYNPFEDLALPVAGFAYFAASVSCISLIFTVVGVNGKLNSNVPD